MFCVKKPRTQTSSLGATRGRARYTLACFVNLLLQLRLSRVESVRDAFDHFSSFDPWGCDHPTNQTHLDTPSTLSASIPRFYRGVLVVGLEVEQCGSKLSMAGLSKRSSKLANGTTLLEHLWAVIDCSR